MDITILVLIVGGGLLLIGIIAFMLNRAWGDFPGRISMPPPSEPLHPPKSVPSSWDVPRERDEPDEPTFPAGAPEGGLIEVKHPLVQRTIAQALERGGSPYATYFMRHGEIIYLNLDRIADPQQRMRIAQTFTMINEGKGGDMSLPEMIRAMQELSRLR